MVVKISDQRSIPHAEADRGIIRRCRECTTGLILLATWCPELSRSILLARCAALHSIQTSPKIDHCGREERAPKFCERQRPLIRAGFQKNGFIRQEDITRLSEAQMHSVFVSYLAHLLSQKDATTLSFGTQTRLWPSIKSGFDSK